jgi:DNA-binding MarR family transcriptional regulator
MDGSKTDPQQSGWQLSSGQRPLFEMLQRRTGNCFHEPTPVSPRFSQALPVEALPQAGDVASQTSNLQDETALKPYDESNFDDPQFLSAAAAEIYRMRRARDHVLPSELTGEPAWDMLLAMYSEEATGMTISSVCYGSGVPHSTAVRWISMLEQEGLIERVEHPRDEKIILVSLTASGRSLVEAALKAMLRAFGI